MDLNQNAEALSSRASPVERKPAPTSRVGEYKLTQEQRSEIATLLALPDRPSLAEISRRTGANPYAVQRLAVKITEAENPRGETVIARYQRRLAKRLPVRVRTDILADVARGVIGPAAGRVQLDAIKRADELDGVVTAEKRQESESNARLVPLFVLPAQASPAVDVVPVDVRHSQDES